MATFTTLLHLTLVAPNQNQKETTINSNFAIIEAALNDDIALSLASGARTLSTDEFTKYFHQVYSGQTAARQVTIPNTARFFAVSNTGTYDITIKANGSSGAILTVPAGKRVLVLSDGVDVRSITSGVNQLQDLTNVIGADDASSGQILAFTGTNWEPVDVVAEEALFHAGTATSSQKVYGKIFTRTTTFLSDFNLSQAKAGVAATGTPIFSVTKNGTPVGTVTFSGTSATFSTDVGSGSTTVTFGAGDVMLIIAPSSADGTLADFLITLRGVNH